MKIIQILPSMSFGDAVSNDALAMREVIEQMGYETRIYAEHIHKKLLGQVRPYKRWSASAKRMSSSTITLSERK